MYIRLDIILAVRYWTPCGPVTLPAHFAEVSHG